MFRSSKSENLETAELFSFCLLEFFSKKFRNLSKKFFSFGIFFKKTLEIFCADGYYCSRWEVNPHRCIIVHIQLSVFIIRSLSPRFHIAQIAKFGFTEIATAPSTLRLGAVTVYQINNHFLNFHP